MFLSLSKIFRNRFTRNAFLFYFVSQLVVVGLLLLLIYISLSHALENNLKQLITAKENQLATLYRAGGIKSFDHQIPDDLYVRLSDEKGFTLFESNLKNEQGYDHKEALAAAHTPVGKSEWIWLHKTDDEDRLWVLSEWITPGIRLQVGKSDEVNDDQVDSLLEIYLGIIIPLLVFAFGFALWFTSKISNQLNEVVTTLQKIKSGDLKERVPVENSALKDMVVLFNQMLDQIEILVIKNRDELDHFAHDVKTPITQFKLIAENAFIDSRKPELAMRALESASIAADEIIQMITSLFDISLSESGAKELNKTNFDFSQLIHDVLNVYELLTHEKNIVFEFLEKPSITVVADRFQMKRVISNVIDNAVKFSTRGSVIHLQLRVVDGMAEFSVRDHGKGIPEDDLPLVWNRFFRSKQSGGEVPGFGLGLSFVKAMTEANGGRVQLFSKVGEGSELVISLPVVNVSR